MGHLANQVAAQKAIRCPDFMLGSKVYHWDEVLDTVTELPKDWMGIVTSADDVHFHWYLGQDEGERSFTPLDSRTYEGAKAYVKGMGWPVTQ